MGKPQINFRLPHLLLWRKGWYRGTKEDTILIIKKCLSLDGYEFVNTTLDITNIVLGAFDDFCKSCDKYKLYRPGFQQLYNDTKNKLIIYPMSFELCLVLAILDYIAWYEGAKIKIDKPHFDRKLYKFGLIFGGPKKIGMTYKEINKYIDSYNW